MKQSAKMTASKSVFGALNWVESMPSWLAGLVAIPVLLVAIPWIAITMPARKPADK